MKAKDHIMLCSDIDAEKHLSRAGKAPKLNADIQIQPRKTPRSTLYPMNGYGHDRPVAPPGGPAGATVERAMNGYGHDRPVAPAGLGTAAEAQPAPDTKTALRSGRLGHALFQNPHGQQISPAISNDPSAASDNR